MNWEVSLSALLSGSPLLPSNAGALTAQGGSCSTTFALEVLKLGLFPSLVCAGWTGEVFFQVNYSVSTEGGSLSFRDAQVKGITRV